MAAKALYQRRRKRQTVASKLSEAKTFAIDGNCARAREAIYQASRRSKTSTQRKAVVRAAAFVRAQTCFVHKSY